MQKRLPLVLSAKTSTFRANDANAESADEDYHRVRPGILRRDDDTCRFCGFRDKGEYIQVHHLDDDHSNNDPRNLATACVHCHAVHHVGLWGVWGDAVLVHLPEIEQWQLSHVCRSLLVALHYPVKLSRARDPVPQDRLDAANRMANSAKVIFGQLKARAAGARELIGTSDPRILGNVVSFLPPEEYAQREGKLAGIRLLVTDRYSGGANGIDRFQNIAHSWMDRVPNGRNGPFASLLPQDWAGLASRSAPRHA